MLHGLWAFPDRALHQASKTIRLDLLWLAAVFEDEHACVLMLKRLVQTLRCGCKMGRACNSPSTFERLLEFELPCLN
jgi:hypothetical protein